MWTEKELREWGKGHSGEVSLAGALRAKTTMPLAWIVQRLAMGSRGLHLAALSLREVGRHNNTLNRRLNDLRLLNTLYEIPNPSDAPRLRLLCHRM
jgi:hypothetical protein